MKQETLKKIVELADGFEMEENEIMHHWFSGTRLHLSKVTATIWAHYPVLLRRAAEGWNKSNPPICYFIDLNKEYLQYGDNCYPNHPLLWYKNYQKTDYLTPQEQAIEACLIELLENK